MARPVIHLIAAARPNFMKVAPLWHALVADGTFDARLVHTGQHYDANMSDAFFRDLGLPEPHHHLGIGSGSHAEQTARVMMAYEPVASVEQPAFTVVVGDVNSTVAVTLVCAKLGRRTVHLEAGLRSFDRTMPEEINRLVTDVLADLLWTPSPDGDLNLRREGIPAERIERVGNIMLDSYELQRQHIEADDTVRTMGLAPRQYGVVTLHRPSNVDDQATLRLLVDALARVAAEVPLVFPAHPRTRKNLQQFGLLTALDDAPGVQLCDPVGYVQFMNLVSNSALCITDSGGIQEETTYLDIPCLTLRPNTERPITVTEGTNRLVTPANLVAEAARALRGDWPHGRRPDRWDGKTAVRCVASLKKHL
ncbi:MAG: UDP-N-acetylglucosamine 2-epimerase (non-hydrolyzing) [Chromatiales bacterium]|jgi:UDP-N-acetylglucosamine 2-epimerase (non-hydrolysing)|nr:MAG: UDP-N-acetylglucosamine 2-epimerase (non-hydrolyzing) [Chromatiales bacterium]